MHEYGISKKATKLPLKPHLEEDKSHRIKYLINKLREFPESQEKDLSALNGHEYSLSGSKKKPP